MIKLGKTILVAILALLWVCGDAAWGYPDEIGTLTIHHAYAEPARSGSDTVVRLAIENNGASTRQFVGLHIDVAQASQIEVKVGHERFVPITSIAILPGELLDLRDGARIRLLSLNRTLTAGESLEAHLDFADGREKRIQVMVDGGKAGHYPLIRCLGMLTGGQHPRAIH